MNNLSTQQKIAIGVGAAATMGAVIAAYIYTKSGKLEEVDEDEDETPTQEEKVQEKPVIKSVDQQGSHVAC
jgi:hypothetical protein